VKILSFDELKTVKGIRYSKAQIYRKIKEGSFPRQVHLGQNCVGFLEAEVDQYIADRVAARDETSRTEAM